MSGLGEARHFSKLGIFPTSQQVVRVGKYPAIGGEFLESVVVGEPVVAIGFIPEPEAQQWLLRHRIMVGNRCGEGIKAGGR